MKMEAVAVNDIGGVIKLLFIGLKRATYNFHRAMLFPNAGRSRQITQILFNLLMNTGRGETSGRVDRTGAMKDMLRSA
jgi:hypothetical protein